ncbi:MAG TPA: PAS domain-containing sensor histidine kinase [Candidatus Limnocylindrales bacterium]|nr:PAS domain-containing sensor histidine kinase [Candidatus Limnocylindrales bacterium]
MREPHEPTADSGASTAERLEREANLSALFRQIDEGFCLAEMVVDDTGAAVDYRFLEVNPQFEAMTGLRDAAGRTALELVPDLERHWVDAYARVGFGREVLRFEQGSDAMGRRFDVFATPVGPHGRFAIVFKDVTERYLAEVALRDSEARWRGIFDNAAVGVAQVDLAGRWVQVNGKLAEITGYAPEELVGRTFADITHPDDVAEDMAQRARLLAGEIDTYTLEKRYLRKDGQETWVNLTVSLARGVDGQPDVLITVVQDIAERRDADARLRTALAIKDEFLGHVSHELRTPLTVIYGMSRMLIRPELDPAQARAIGADIADSAEQLNALVESMLLLARLDQHEAGQLREPVLLHRAAGEVLARFRERDPGRTYELRTATHETLVDVQPGWLARVIENLVGNAAKYAGAGTPVLVEIEPDPRGVRLTVLDEGPGISDDDLERVFEPFFRSEDARQRASGSGLGLAVSRRIIELLGGTIGAARRPEGGSAFAFTLPLADEDSGSG